MTKSAERLELNKILAAAAEFAVTEGGKARVLKSEPARTLSRAQELLACTEEARLLLFELGSGQLEAFPPLGDKAERAEKGSVLSCEELTDTALVLRSARVCYTSVRAVRDGRIEKLSALAERLECCERLEGEIGEKISGGELCDTASEKLFSIRREIRAMQERVRARLGEYLTGGERKYLQDGIVTVRGDRFVIPVKAEYKRSVKGFVHDRSQSGATFFIEPEEVLGMNNELVSLLLDEREETERILAELSRAVGAKRAALERNVEILNELDECFARAEYGYRLRCTKPALNGKGVLDIRLGRHPLLGKDKAIPVSVRVGKDYDFLVISGANTGGKTVTLKMCGLFCLMGACGFFVPAADGTELPVFSQLFCDLGDSQSIEESLSTFSSHAVELKNILGHAGRNTFVLIDEPGGGTDPEEGQALARAVLEELAEKGCRGIVTTHYSSLKEFAFEKERLENACMEFDAEDHRPLYRLRVGAPGSSNALAVCERLGLPAETVERARGFLSEGARSFERTMRAAEESRIRAEEAERGALRAKAEWEERLAALRADEEKLAREREKFVSRSRAEARRIVNERTARAEELLAEIEATLSKETVTEGDLIRARTLKNRMGEQIEEEKTVRRTPADPRALKAGDRVFVGSLEAEGKVLSVRAERGVCEVQVGALRVRAEIGDLYEASARQKEEDGVQVVRNLSESAAFRPECNLIGMTAAEAVPALEAFLDGALLSGAGQVRIVHGMGTGRLRAGVRDFLKKHPRVESFRSGGYGEGGSGVTVVILR